MNRIDDVALASRPRPAQRGRLEMPVQPTVRLEPVGDVPQAPACPPEVLGLSPVQRACKRIFDVVTALVVFVLFSWAIVAVAIAVAFTTGRPVIFSHMRVGRHGRDFKCFKFRSMVPDADERLAQLLETDPEALIEWERDFKLKNDPRVTRVGRFIRKTSFDEFPQLWNVIRGDMSVVGPRPVVLKELDLYYADARDHYLAVKPGLTGPWQISGRNDMEYSERVALDRVYVESWSLWSDLVIVFATAKAMVARSGAY